MAFHRGIELGNSYREYRKRLTERGETFPKISTDGLSLLYDFNSTTPLQSILPDNSANLTFTRDSSGSFLDSDGLIKFVGPNEPRLEYSSSGEFKGLLLEPPSTNYFTYSQEFDNSIWLVSDGEGTRATITPNQTTAPDGTQTADLLVPTSTITGEHPMRYNNSTMDSGLFTSSFAWSIHVKPAGNDYFGLRTNVNGSWSAVMFNIQNGTVYSASPNYTDYSIDYISNGWYRIGVIAPNATTPSLQHISSPNGSISFTGDDVSGAYVWGAQFEKINRVSSYIKTEANTVARQRDMAITPTLQFDSSTWSVFFETDIFNPDSVNGNTYVQASPLRWYFRSIGTTLVNFWNQNDQQNIRTIPSVVNGETKIKGLLIWDGSKLKATVNGTALDSGLTPNTPSVFNDFIRSIDYSYSIRLFSGTVGADIQSHKSNFNKLLLFKRPLTNEEAITLTTI